MKIWHGKLNLRRPVTRQLNAPTKGKEVNARIIMGETIVLYTSQANDELGVPLWSIANVEDICPYSMLKLIAETGQDVMGKQVRLTNC